MGISRPALYDNNAPVSSANTVSSPPSLGSWQPDMVIVMLSVSAADSPAQPQNGREQHDHVTPVPDDWTRNRSVRD